MREYRQNAHVRSLVIWAVLCVVVAIVLFLQRELRWVEIVGGVVLLIIGPVGLAVYLIRVETHWVSVDPERGILVRGKRLILWEEIVRNRSPATEAALVDRPCRDSWVRFRIW